LSVSIENGKLFISAKIYDIENNMVTEIIKNEWNTPNKDFQINYDNTALEVIDKHNIPVLQIELYDTNRIILGGMFYYNDRLLVCTDNGIQEIPEISSYYETEKIKRKFIENLLSYIPQMTRIFKYVGNEWIGIRNLDRKVSNPLVNILYIKSERF